MMPLWLQYMFATAAIVTAFGVFFAVSRLAGTAAQMLPPLRQLTEAFEDARQPRVLDEMAAQLRDIVSRLESSSEANRTAAELLKVGVASERQLSALDREQMLRLIILLNDLGVVVTASAATGDRIEQHGLRVSDDLSRAHGRANGVTDGEPGAAADAAAQMTEREVRESEG